MGRNENENLALGALDANGELLLLDVDGGDLEGVRHRGATISAIGLANKTRNRERIDLKRDGLARRGGALVIEADLVLALHLRSEHDVDGAVLGHVDARVLRHRRFLLRRQLLATRVEHLDTKE